MSLQHLNDASTEQFFERIGGPLEGQTWLAERVLRDRPFDSVEALFSAFQRVVDDATEAEKIALITSHPDLAGKAMLDNTLSDASQKEQAAAGLDRLSAQEFSQFHAYNGAYKDKFGFPFVICARENTKNSILTAFPLRLENDRSQEITTGVTEVLKILRLRLIDQFA